MRRGPRMLWLFGSSILLCLVLVTSLHAQWDTGPPSGTPFLAVTVNPHSKEHPPNAFQGQGKALNAELFGFALGLYQEARIEKIVFQLFVKGDVITFGEHYKLFVDKNQDGKIDAEDFEVGGSGKVEGNRVVFSAPFVISSYTAFILRGDFPKLEPGLYLAVNIDLGGLVVKATSGIDTKVQPSTTIYSAEHQEPYASLKARASLASSVIVGEQDVTLFMDVEYLRGVEVFWQGLQQIPGWKMKGSPQMSEIEGLDILKRRVTITLFQEKGRALGRYTIKLPTLRYRDTLDKNATDRHFSFPPLQIRKERVHAVVTLPQHTITMAYPLLYELRFYLDPAYVVPTDYLDELKLREWWDDFKISQPRLSVLESRGARIISYQAILSYLGPPQKIVVLSREEVPYVKAGGVSSELFTHSLPEVSFPFHSLTEKMGQGKELKFEPLEYWRHVEEGETVILGLAMGDAIILLLLVGAGFLLLLLVVKEAVRIFKGRKTNIVWFGRRVVMTFRRQYFLRSLRRCMTAIHFSDFIRSYAGVMSGKGEEFARSALFKEWAQNRYPKEQELWKILGQVEERMLREGVGWPLEISPKRKALGRSLRYISRRERRERWIGPLRKFVRAHLRRKSS